MSEIPVWAKARACELVRVENPDADVQPEDHFPPFARALARYIAAHEEAPVDPLLIEAREIAAQAYSNRRDHDFAGWIRRGDKDSIYEVQVALAALRRGMELAKSHV